MKKKAFHKIEEQVPAFEVDIVGSREMKTVLDLIPDGIWICDGDGKVLTVNRASEVLNRISASDIVGKRVGNMVEKGLMDRSVTHDVLRMKRRVSIMQYVANTKKYLLVTGTPFLDENGDIRLVVVNERDMTQLNAAQSELEMARRMGEKYKDEITQLNMLELINEELITESEKMRVLLKTALKLASQEISNILILGESGAGKGLLAKIIHKHGARSKESFIHINCAALPESLLEAELFGYEKGAFTGASEKGKAGLFELADGGTLFLDEIGDLPLTTQAKLLKYLDDNEIIHLGGVKPIKIDCTVVAATNRDLLGLVNRKRFRLDLYYRLNSFTIRIPPLRERKEDILALTQHFLKRYNEEFKTRKKISASGFELLQRYAFPGNIRELKNIVKQAVVLGENELIDKQVAACLEIDGEKADPRSPVKTTVDGSLSLEKQIAVLEKSILVDAIGRHKSTRKIANYLGTSQSSVMRKIKKHGLKLP